MLKSLKKELNLTKTENGAVTYASSLSDCLDFFSTAGALRNAPDSEIERRFCRAYLSSPNIAMKALFYARDVRGGLGERRVFRVALRWLCENAPVSVIRNISYIAEYGRFDDLLCLMDTACEKYALEYMGKTLNNDINAMDSGREVSLLAKWLPSVNTSNARAVMLAKKIAKGLGMSQKRYRKTLSALRERIRIVENNLRKEDYSFSYEKLPAKALFKYREAFMRKDTKRYEKYLSLVRNKRVKIHTSVLYPYEVVRPFYMNKEISPTERTAIDITWNNLENYTNGQNALVVADGSGSMYGGGNPLPACVAQSLAVYFAQRNKGPFEDCFITFSHKPQLIQLPKGDILSKLRYCASFNEVADTNIEAVFDLILNAAKKNRIPQKQMPEVIYIISDMEFNYCAQNAQATNFENAKNKYRTAGYKLPHIVFWNVASRNLQQPVTKNDQGAVLVSGCSPMVFETVTGKDFSPEGYMLKILGSSRYKKIAA